jgi:replication initiation and membrane attachment protein DnaB
MKSKCGHSSHHFNCTKLKKKHFHLLQNPQYNTFLEKKSSCLTFQSPCLLFLYVAFHSIIQITTTTQEKTQNIDQAYPKNFDFEQFAPSLLHSHKSHPTPLNDKRQIIVWFLVLKIDR